MGLKNGERIIDEIVIDGEVIAWPRCIMPQCTAGVCFDLSPDFCFPHSAERLNINPHFEWTLNFDMLIEFNWRGNDAQPSTS